MAASILGLTTLTFGTPTIGGLIVSSVEFNENTSQAEVADEDGDFVAAAIYGKNVEVSVEGVAYGGAFNTGATIVITGAPTGTYYITQKTTSMANQDFKRLSISAKSWF